MTCRRLEDAGWLADLGDTLDPHVDECADCRAGRDEYLRLTAAVRSAGADRALPPDWKQRTLVRLAAVASSTPAPPPAAPVVAAAPRRARSRIAAAISLAAVAAVVVVVIARRAPPDRPPAVASLAIAVVDGTGTRRGTEAEVGDTLTFEARAGGTASFELRVYRAARELVLRCGTASPSPCRPSADGLTASLALASPGEYVVVWLVSDAALPPPNGTFDADLAAVRAAHARVAATETIDVR